MKVFDLFAGLRGWSAPFADRGHEVLTLDYDPRFGADFTADILTWDPAAMPWRPDIILASPDCSAFTVMNIGKNWTGPDEVPPHAPKTPLARLGVSMVERTREVIFTLRPAYYVIENPRGKLRKLPVVADLERRTVTYCQYGETRMKPTDLWGGFPPSLRLLPPCHNGDPCHTRAPRGSKTPGSVQGQDDSAERSKIPYALALAVCEAAERDLSVGAVSGADQGALW